MGYKYFTLSVWGSTLTSRILTSKNGLCTERVNHLKLSLASVTKHSYGHFYSQLLQKKCVFKHQDLQIFGLKVRVPVIFTRKFDVMLLALLWKHCCCDPSFHLQLFVGQFKIVGMSKLIPNLGLPECVLTLFVI